MLIRFKSHFFVDYSLFLIFYYFSFCQFFQFSGIQQCSGKKIRYYFRKNRERNSAVAPSSRTIKCRSRRPIVNMVCSSTCPSSTLPMRRVVFGQSDAATSSCCRPIRTVAKTIKMTCDDGSAYRQTIQRIRRCACQSCT